MTILAIPETVPWAGLLCELALTWSEDFSLGEP